MVETFDTICGKEETKFLRVQLATMEGMNDSQQVSNEIPTYPLMSAQIQTKRRRIQECLSCNKKLRSGIVISQLLK
jgi:hypothetical protein